MQATVAPVRQRGLLSVYCVCVFVCVCARVFVCVSDTVCVCACVHSIGKEQLPECRANEILSPLIVKVFLFCGTKFPSRIVDRSSAAAINT